MEVSQGIPHEVSVFIYIFSFLIINVAEIQMSIFPICQNHLNCRKKVYAIIYSTSV